MSGVVVLVSIMLVLTYGKSRKKAGASPICGVIGTLPFQILMVVSTIVSAIGCLLYTSSAQTGDTMHAVPFALAMIISAGVVVMVVSSKKKVVK